MITKCPYDECAAEFEVDFEMPEGDWHWPAGLCSRCEQPCTFRPLNVMQSLQKNFEKRKTASLNVGGPERDDLPPLVALAEDFRSMWNVGALFRTCDGAGVGKLYLTGTSAAPPRKEIEKTSLGSELSVPWEYSLGSVAVLRELRKQGVQIVGLERNASSRPLFDACRQEGFGTKVCILVGNEVMGVSAEALHLCDLVCHLPMHGVKESLNAAVAFGIAAYAVRDYLDQALRGTEVGGAPDAPSSRAKTGR